MPSSGSPSSPSEPPRELGRTRKALVFAAVGLGLLMGMIDQTAVATALTSMQADLGTSFTWVGWTISGYGLGQIVSLPVAGRLADQFGRRRVFLTAVGVFTVASLCAATAPSVGVLIVLRVLQGAAGGALLPSATGIVAETFGRNRDRAVALFSTVFPTGAVLGPVVGAVLVTVSGWRAIFWVNVPIGIVVALAGLLLVPRSARGAGSAGRIDVRGAVLLAAALTGGMLAVSALGTLGGGSGHVGAAALAVGAVVVAALGGVLLVRHLRRAADPLVPLDLLRGRTFRALNIANLVFGVAAIAQSSLIPTYAHLRYGIDPVVAGGLLALRALAMIVTSSVSVAVIRRVGFRPLLVGGSLVIVVGLVVFAVPPPPGVGPAVWLGIGAALTGVGMGLNAPASSNAGLHLATEHVSAVSGLRGMFRQCGGATGVALLTAVATAFPDAGLAQSWGQAALAVVLALTVPLMLRIPNQRGSW